MRRLFAALLMWSLALSGPVVAAAPDFATFLEGLWPKASAAGVARATFDQVTAGLTPDPTIPSPGGRQPEFDTPVWTYLASAVSARRVEQGRRMSQRWRAQLDAIAMRSGVPAEIILAAWGMEADFGQAAGSRDVIRSLATLAFTRQQSPIFADEFVAALVMLDREGVPRARLRGSWAGAMGMPQFMPSAYLKFAETYSGDGAADIWTSPPDALASIASFLQKSGWRSGAAWGAPVRVPPGFDFASLHGDMAAWAAQGLRTVNGPKLAASGDATLYMPAGAAGPAFLLAENYWVLKQYNNSDSYALSLALLAERIAGRSGGEPAWPKGLRLLSRSERLRLQRGLAALGFYKGVFDGKLGPTSRDAVHDFQRAAGLSPADGFATPAVLARLDAMTPGR